MCIANYQFQINPLALKPLSQREIPRRLSFPWKATNLGCARSGARHSAWQMRWACLLSQLLIACWNISYTEDRSAGGCVLGHCSAPHTGKWGRKPFPWPRCSFPVLSQPCPWPNSQSCWAEYGLLWPFWPSCRSDGTHTCRDIQNKNKSSKLKSRGLEKTCFSVETSTTCIGSRQAGVLSFNIWQWCKLFSWIAAQEPCTRLSFFGKPFRLLCT